MNTATWTVDYLKVMVDSETEQSHDFDVYASNLGGKKIDTFWVFGHADGKHAIEWLREDFGNLEIRRLI